MLPIYWIKGFPSVYKYSVISPFKKKTKAILDPISLDSYNSLCLSWVKTLKRVIFNNAFFLDISLVSLWYYSLCGNCSLQSREGLYSIVNLHFSTYSPWHLSFLMTLHILDSRSTILLDFSLTSVPILKITILSSLTLLVMSPNFWSALILESVFMYI